MRDLIEYAIIFIVCFIIGFFARPLIDWILNVRLF